MCYVIVWESLTEEGFQYDIVKTTQSIGDARCICRDLLEKFISACDNNEGFDNYSVKYYSLAIKVRSDDNPDFYHIFKIVYA